MSQNHEHHKDLSDREMGQNLKGTFPTLWNPQRKEHLSSVSMVLNENKSQSQEEHVKVTGPPTAPPVNYFI